MSFSPLFTDLYQLTMAEAYFASGHSQAQATFELFFRRCPFRGEYAVVAGHDLVQEILENFKFSESEIDYLKSLPMFKKASPDFFEQLRRLNLDDVEIFGIPEGKLVFPRLPLLQVRGPIFKVQLLETSLLNAMNFATLIATYARRIRVIAPEKRLIEFGMRRAQGPNGAMTASRSSFLAGFDGTSNALSGMKLKIPAVGTMAHSFVQSFSDLSSDLLNWNGKSITEDLNQFQKEDGLQTNRGELAAFLAYARAFPDHCLLLIDTYDSLRSGLPNAIRVFKLLRKFGHSPLGVRLDSGDLGYLSKEARRLLNEAGLHEAKIFASNELDERVIETLEDQGAEIDTYGIGTHLVTAASEPALGGVYKLVEVDGMPRMKISQQTEKLVIPGAKNIYRLYGSDGHMILDLMTVSGEPAPKEKEEILAFHPSDPFKQAYVTPSRVEPLLVPLFQGGKWLKTESLIETRKRSLEEMKALRSDTIRVAYPTPYKISLSRKLKELLDSLYAKERPAPVLK